MTKDNEPNKLKACPFCGSDVIHAGYQVDSPLRHYRECQKCLARIHGYDTAEQADAAWNNRACPTPPSPPDGSFAYVGITPCGCVRAICADAPQFTESIKDFMVQCVDDGWTVGRMPDREAIAAYQKECPHKK